MSIRRDYKSAAPGQRRQSARRHGLLVITLVLIGLFSGFLAYIKGDRTRPAPAAATAVAPPPPQSPSVSTPAAPPKTVVAPVVESAPTKPKYDFYTELPKRQIDVQRETVNPRNAPQPPSPTRTQPAADQLRKPAAPRKNATTPIMAAASAKSDSKPAIIKPAIIKPANAATAKPANAATVKPATATSAPTTTQARTAQLPRPLASNGSKIVVKTEQEP
ncbi:MAG: hypothetical protein WAV07_20560 [Candidatus Contendobacter sp.]